MKNQALKIQVIRGPCVESEHWVDAIVVDSKGNVKASYGEADVIKTFPRSAIKMLQAVSFVESGAFQKLELSKAHLALASSSHQGEARHTEMVQAWLKKLDLSEGNLICGAHYPADEKTKFEMIQKGKLPSACHNNCSGKHTAFLSTLKFLALPVENYQDYDHPLQVRLRDLLSELCEEDIHQALWGVDGCGIPTYSMKLISIAKGMSKFLATAGEKYLALRKILESVQAEPSYFSGSQGFAHTLIEVTKGDSLVKSGAEGVYAGLCVSKDFSFALKVRDGNPRAATVSSLWILNQFGALSIEQKVRLSEHSEPSIKNWAGEVVGKIIVHST